MVVVSTPSPVVRQTTGTDPEGRYILSVLCKTSYAFTPGGRVYPAEQQQPLVEGLRHDEKNPELLAADIDLYPYKVATDIVLKGCAYAYRPSPQFDVSLRVGAFRKTIRVFGNRRCSLSNFGQILFSPPEPTMQIPLSYGLAYGGEDRAMTAKYGNPNAELNTYLGADLAASPYAYPRNPAGRGYLVELTAEALAQLELPNLEDPTDLLTPDRLACRTHTSWPAMPLPQGMDWVGVGWFPRLAYWGFVPIHDTPAKPIAEVARGYAPADILVEKPIAEKFNFRCANGASLGLQVPYLVGGEEVELQNLHPQAARIAFRLPATRPKIWTDGRKGKLNATTPVIHTVLIDPEKGLLTVVWRGSAQALRPYLPEELEKMPLRVEWP